MRTKGVIRGFPFLILFVSLEARMNSGLFKKVIICSFGLDEKFQRLES